jgi:hypothetical protein
MCDATEPAMDAVLRSLRHFQKDSLAGRRWDDLKLRFILDTAKRIFYVEIQLDFLTRINN